MCGAFAADALRQRLGDAVDLHVVDRADRVGGRAHQRGVWGVDVEAGASLFHSANRLLVGAADELGLHSNQVESGGSIGIWDGTRLLLRTRGGRLDPVQLILRYRLDLLKAQREVSRFVDSLDGVYPQLGHGACWPTPRDLWGALGLFDTTQEAADRHFAQGRFATEFMDAVSRNNYAQDRSELNTLVELVSLAGAGLGGGHLLRVAEGNGSIAAGLLDRARVDLHTSAAVRRIARRDGGWSLAGEGFAPLDADAIVLAAPLEVAEIEVVGAPTPAPRSYVSVHVTFVSGALRPSALGLDGAPPGFVLTTPRAGSILSIERVGSTSAGAPLHKVFSTTELTEARLAELFEVRDVDAMCWPAYPRLAPRADWPAFQLAPGLYYPSAMEYAVSTMETQAVAGVAVANLLVAGS